MSVNGRKSGKKSGAPQLAMRPGPRGGLLRNGSSPGNTPGTGRPPSELRARLRGSFEERVQVLEAFADGEVECSPSDRLRAIELLARYGLGAPPLGIDLNGSSDASRGGIVYLPAPVPLPLLDSVESRVLDAEAQVSELFAPAPEASERADAARAIRDLLRARHEGR